MDYFAQNSRKFGSFSVILRTSDVTFPTTDLFLLREPLTIKHQKRILQRSEVGEGSLWRQWPGYTNTTGAGALPVAMDIFAHQELL